MDLHGPAQKKLIDHLGQTPDDIVQQFFYVLLIRGRHHDLRMLCAANTRLWKLGEDPRSWARTSWLIGRLRVCVPSPNAVAVVWRQVEKVPAAVCVEMACELVRQIVAWCDAVPAIQELLAWSVVPQVEGCVPASRLDIRQRALTPLLRHVRSDRCRMSIEHRLSLERRILRAGGRKWPKRLAIAVPDSLSRLESADGGARKEVPILVIRDVARALSTTSEEEADSIWDLLQQHVDSLESPARRADCLSEMVGHLENLSQAKQPLAAKWVESKIDAVEDAAVRRELILELRPCAEHASEQVRSRLRMAMKQEMTTSTTFPHRLMCHADIVTVDDHDFAPPTKGSTLSKCRAIRAQGMLLKRVPAKSRGRMLKTWLENFLLARNELMALDPDERDTRGAVKALTSAVDVAFSFAPMLDKGEMSEAIPVYESLVAAIFPSLFKFGASFSCSVLDTLVFSLAASGRLHETAGLIERVVAILARSLPPSDKSGSVRMQSNGFKCMAVLARVLWQLPQDSCSRLGAQMATLLATGFEGLRAGWAFEDDHGVWRLMVALLELWGYREPPPGVDVVGLLQPLVALFIKGQQTRSMLEQSTTISPHDYVVIQALAKAAHLLPGKKKQEQLLSVLHRLLYNHPHRAQLKRNDDAYLPTLVIVTACRLAIRQGPADRKYRNWAKKVLVELRIARSPKERERLCALLPTATAKAVLNALHGIVDANDIAKLSADPRVDERNRGKKIPLAESAGDDTDVDTDDDLDDDDTLAGMLSEVGLDGDNLESEGLDDDDLDSEDRIGNDDGEEPSDG